MTNNTDNVPTTVPTDTWQLTALTEALGDLTLTVNDSLSVGRGSDNDVVLGSKQVSRNHALLSVLDGQLYVKDLDSSNGTFINEQRIEGNTSRLLQVSDTIGIASFNFRVNAPVAATDPEASAPVTAEGSVTHSAVSVDADADADAKDVNNDNEAVTTQSIAEENIIEESTVKNSIVENNTAAAPINEAPVIDDAVNNQSMRAEPIVKETAIEEILSSAENVEVAPASTTTIPNESAVEQSLAREEAAIREPETKEPTNEAPVVQPEHDKTTKTALQEEADPDILRAKQAATAQFSGTANLGQSHDLGTEGNNAMDQAIENPANPNVVEKKPSGSWFIWVFLAVIIIGLALWLFNMGGV